MHAVNPRKPVRNRGECRRFTLIELLIVIGIISILAALLLPALKSARDITVHMKCLNNIHQQALSIIMYTMDNDGVWPLTTDGPWAADKSNNNDFRALGQVLMKTAFPKATPIFAYEKFLFTNYLCPASPSKWGMKIVNGRADDTDTSDGNNRLGFPGGYNCSFVKTLNPTRSDISGKSMSSAGTGGGDPYQNTPPSNTIMINDIGFVYQLGQTLPSDSDHPDGKWNVMFIDGHGKHYVTPNGRDWNYIFTLSSSLSP